MKRSAFAVKKSDFEPSKWFRRIIGPLFGTVSNMPTPEFDMPHVQRNFLAFVDGERAAAVLLGMIGHSHVTKRTQGMRFKKVSKLIQRPIHRYTRQPCCWLSSIFLVGTIGHDSYCPVWRNKELDDLLLAIPTDSLLASKSSSSTWK